MNFTLPAPSSISTTKLGFNSNPSAALNSMQNPALRPPPQQPLMPQGLSSRNASQTLFPKPIDVVALLSGADQFGTRHQVPKQQSHGLPGPMQLFSALSISEGVGGNGKLNRDATMPIFTSGQSELIPKASLLPLNNQNIENNVIFFRK